jgi:hypothetical protein
MAFARRLGVVSILGACWFAAVACADDEDRNDTSEDGGEGGDEGGGKAGTPSAGGNSTNGGKAGMSSGGKAGSSTAGEGGSGTAGDAGSGSGGDAGSGGSMGGAGGEGGSVTVGGEGGLSSGGAGGEGGAPAAVAQRCVDACEDDDDCVDAAGFPKKCNELSNLCETCVVDEDCAPELSDWFTGCETTADCIESYFACVDYRGNTYCAIVDDPQNGAGCADLGAYEATTAALHEGGADISVCVKPTARCFDGACDFSCETFDSCPAAEGDTCNPVSGRCECQSGTECATGVCVNNLCTQCATDADCAPGAAQTGHDTCVAGKCGCADVGSCPTGLYPAATNACQ